MSLSRTAARYAIFEAIHLERWRQDNQHGAQQDLPVVRACERYLDPENVMRARYERRKRAGNLSHADIILEEMAEAFDATTVELMREELIQSAACIVKAIEAIDWQAKRKVEP